MTFDLNPAVCQDFFDNTTLEIVINSFPNKPWCLFVCSTSLVKTLWEKEKFLVMSNFSFPTVLSDIFIKFKIVVYKYFQFGSLKFVVCWTDLLGLISKLTMSVRFISYSRNYSFPHNTILTSSQLKTVAETTYQMRLKTKDLSFKGKKI